MVEPGQLTGLSSTFLFTFPLHILSMRPLVGLDIRELALTQLLVR
jgi:hypothetical protein